MNKLIIIEISVLMLLCGCSREKEYSHDGPQQGMEIKEEVIKTKVKEHRSGKWTPGLSEDEKETLFEIARDTLEWCVKGSKGEFSFEQYTITPKLNQETHTFVTLKISGMLRGCIGSLPPMRAAPIYRSVYNNTINAAMKDWRFGKVTVPELDKIDIHISLLSPVSDIASIAEFNLGEHGIIIQKGSHRAIYLPEVAVEQGWSKEETLSSLSRKARMSADAWRKGAGFRVFSSVVLSR